jgi:16S rRNA A1518/A1519 N6-dimethyltransferase RsmA/KsgA/DIM1 with predicted DNA glycosylase/AP lyase activity
MRNALRRLGLSAEEARSALERRGIDADARAEVLSLEGFASLAEEL